jgi:hypothetical protein
MPPQETQFTEAPPVAPIVAPQATDSVSTSSVVRSKDYRRIQEEQAAARRAEADAIRAKAAADAAVANAEREAAVALMERNAQADQERRAVEAEFAARKANAEKERESLRKEYEKGPTDYWGSRTTGQKIAAGIAIALGTLSQARRMGRDKDARNPGLDAIEGAIAQHRQDEIARINKIGERMKNLGQDDVSWREEQIRLIDQRIGEGRRAVADRIAVEKAKRGANQSEIDADQTIAALRKEAAKQDLDDERVLLTRVNRDVRRSSGGSAVDGQPRLTDAQRELQRGRDQALADLSWFEEQARRGNILSKASLAKMAANRRAMSAQESGIGKVITGAVSALLPSRLSGALAVDDEFQGLDPQQKEIAIRQKRLGINLATMMRGKGASEAEQRNISQLIEQRPGDTQKDVINKLRGARQALEAAGSSLPGTSAAPKPVDPRVAAAAAKKWLEWYERYGQR